MTRALLVDASLYIHGPLLPVVIGVVIAVGNIGEHVVRNLRDVELLARAIRRRITTELDTCLRPLFEDPGSVPRPLLEKGGGTYVEIPVNPLRSEGFRERLGEFVDGNATGIANYRSMKRAIGRLRSWTKRRSWFLYSLMVNEIVALGVAVAEKFLSPGLPCGLFMALFATMAASIVTVLTSMAVVMRQDGRISDLRGDYEDWAL